jgi:hypothetical protein
MKFPRRLAMLAFSVVAAMSLFVPPANAAVSQPYAYSDCPVGKICVWQLTGGNGLRFESPPIGSGSCQGIGWVVRSVYNRTQVAQRIWSNPNCTGSPFFVPPGYAVDDTGPLRAIGGYP